MSNKDVVNRMAKFSKRKPKLRQVSFTPKYLAAPWRNNPIVQEWYRGKWVINEILKEEQAELMKKLAIEINSMIE